MENEIWKPVVGWEGFYEVSDQGRVKSLDRQVESFHLKQGHISYIRPGRILKPGIVGGYLQVQLFVSPRRAQRKVHQLVLEAFVGPRPAGKEAAHENGIRDDARLENLEWKTHIENEKEKLIHGTRFRGEKHPRAKLTIAEVIAIRAEYVPGRRNGLAAKYGVNAKVIWDIAHRRIWRHVP